MELDPREQDDKAVAKSLEVFGGLCLGFGVKDLLTALTSKTPLNTASALLSFIGAVIFFCGVFWHRIRPTSDTRFTRTLIALASNAHSWYFAIWALVLYVGAVDIIGEIRQNNEIVSLRNDTQSITRVIDRLIMPRHLSKHQQAILSTFLLMFEPHEYAFKLPYNNEEAGSYRVDIEQALNKGGWTISTSNPYEYVNAVNEGIRIEFMQTVEHSHKPSDLKNPKADIILMEAFGVAGIRLDSMGSGDNVNISEDRLVISIGQRRMDSYALVPVE